MRSLAVVFLVGVVAVTLSAAAPRGAGGQASAATPTATTVLAATPTATPSGTPTDPATVTAAPSPTTIAETVALLATVPAGGNGVAVACDRLYVAAVSSGLRVVDVAQPARPVELGRFATAPEWARAVAVAGRYAYVGTQVGLVVVDVADPARPAEVGRLRTHRDTTDLAIVGGPHVYMVAGYGDPLLVVDARDPFRPTLVRSVEGGADYGHSRLVAAGTRVYVLSAGSVLILDASDPADPRVLGAYAPSSHVRSVAVDGAHLYAAAGTTSPDGSETATFRVVDARDPERLLEVGSYRLPTPSLYGHFGEIAVSGGLAWVAYRHFYPVFRNEMSTELGVYVLDVREPAQPRLVGHRTLESGLPRLLAAGDVAYGATGGLDFEASGFGQRILRYPAAAPTVPPAGAHRMLLPYGPRGC